MASYTTNLNLKKPAGSENVAIGDINNNMDAIDAAYGPIDSNLRKYSDADGICIRISSKSLNTIDYNGRVYCQYNCTNLPVADQPGYLDSCIYQKSPLYAKQVFTPYNTSDTYIRICNNGTWTSWKKLAFST